MSEIKGKVGNWDLKWKTVPRGVRGTAQVSVGESDFEVSWIKDSSGIWLELPYGVFGFDFSGVPDDEGTLRYRVRERGKDREWFDLSYQREGEDHAAAGAKSKKKEVKIKSQMPGKIVAVSVKVGEKVEKGHCLIIMEAMKMENDIEAPMSGIVKEVMVEVGAAVESGAPLILLGNGDETK